VVCLLDDEESFGQITSLAEELRRQGKSSFALSFLNLLFLA
jgi:hypothetical protein